MKKTTKPPLKPIATMQLVEITERQKILAGHTVDGDHIHVLRKTDDGEWLLYRIAVSELTQSLRSFIPPDDADDLERVSAILATMAKPKRKRRRKAK